MILESLSITDFRVFKGRHTFDLNPRYKWKQKQPIILFGGLNGAGKTSILTAVRLALYGRQALGHGTTIKAYEEYITSSIHRSRDSVLQAKYASIELSFSYAHMGIQSHYRVVRGWSIRGRKIKENLDIYKADKKFDSLTHDQCQGFLNELVPIGVSDLFFFDGEKIAELAEDTTGTALSDAIKKLLGLDLIEQLNADLSVLLRNQDKVSMNHKNRAEIERLEKALKNYENTANEEINSYSEMRSNWIETTKNLDRLESDLNQRGGAWAASREKELSKSSELDARKKYLENSIRELLADVFPFSIANNMIKNTLSQLDAEQELKGHNQSIEALTKYTKSLQRKLSKRLEKDAYKKVHEVIEQDIKGLVSKTKPATLIHDISDTQYSRIFYVLDEILPSGMAEIALCVKELTQIDEELDNLGKNIARAPDETSLASQLGEIKKWQEKANQIHAKMEMHRERAKLFLRQAMDTTRKLDKLHKSIIEHDDNIHAFKHVSAAKNFLNEFNSKAAKQKIQDLEQEFIKTFKRLARKDDISIKASINPKTFKVTIINEANELVSKDELSAGEKQIYAISILEALARTSGRKLPIIIDTPLGRLDSKHRTKLIENYFPCASQQVIILSTDTEVDEEFYQSLYKHISHAYQLNYDTKSGSSFAEEGYFWRKSEAA